MSVSQLVKNTVRLPIESLAAQFGQHRRRSSESRLWIMMYHRILPRRDPRYALEEPGMIVEPDTFRLHLQVLKKEFTLLPLNEWVERKNSNLPLPEKACAITFDDGWLDNYEYAFPILEQASVPATLFAVSDMIGTCELFWPNRIVRLLQQPSDKRDSIAWLRKLSTNQSIDSEVSAQAIYSLKNKPDHHLLQLIKEAEQTLGIKPETTPSLMNWPQLRQLSDNELFDIGSHTSHHFRLREDLDPDILQQEIAESKKRLEAELGKPVNLFCYPNGDYCDRAIMEIAKHYKAAVTTQSGINNSSSTSLFTLQRFGVHQDVSFNRRKLLAKLANWP